jgi:hypothetical protein
VRQRVLIFDPAVENEAVSEILFESPAFHARADVLDGVQNVHPGFGEVWDEWARRAVGVEENLL